MNNLRIINFTKNKFGPTLFPNNIFDDKFLQEKESALSPILLDDSFPIQTNTSNNITYEKTNSKSIKDRINRISVSSEFKFDKRKSRRHSICSYGSNIVLITSCRDDENKECPVITEINKLLKDPKNLRIKKPNKKKRIRK